tara:strand:- start:2895 stop:3875 length:981 start_codon:yes stop_codon:yes gene_type:complete
MNDSSQPDGFNDLEEMDHVEVERMKVDLLRSLKSVEQELSDLRGERRDQVSLVRTLRTAVGEMEHVSEARKSLLGEFHTVRKIADKARRGRDDVNSRIPPPIEVLNEWLSDTHTRLTTLDNDLTTVPTLARELDSFARFFELQAAISAKGESESYHKKYVKQVKRMREITTKLDSTKRSNPKSEEGVSQNSENESRGISRSEIRKVSIRISNIDKQLDKLNSERKQIRSNLGRVRSYQKATTRDGRPIKLSDIKERAKTGGTLDANELETLLDSANLSELTDVKNESPTDKEDLHQGRPKRKRMRLGATRGGARRGTQAAKREVDE